MAFKKQVEEEFNFDTLEPDSDGRKPKLPAGNYIVETDECGFAAGYKGGGLTFVDECTVVESDNPSVLVGSKRAITIGGLNIPKRKAGAYSRLKALLAASVGCTGNEEAPFEGVTWTQLKDDATGELQALSGTRMHVKTWFIELDTVDDEGKPRLFQLYEFSPAD